MAKSPQQEVKLEIQMDDQVACGQYINMAVVNHNDSEFVIDCIYVQPQAPKARVQARLVTSPRHAKRLLAALQNNVENYEKKFGQIDLMVSDEQAAVDVPMH
ncbi:MAG: DUF3467 domain-containing protein [Deltaproteobacteria bacterium]|jgi:hypothetical protein|nr:DUF3467 domain-containing protein [Deltaproteobacteria bacterium]MCW8892469.1 DUF3467 domain-containing protein [Deltaproteobacteria bacterium]